MRLDRNTTEDGQGKYAVIKMRKFREMTNPNNDKFGRVRQELLTAMDVLRSRGVLAAPDEFFVLMLKDKNTAPALLAYAREAAISDLEYGQAVQDLALESSYRVDLKEPD